MGVNVSEISIEEVKKKVIQDLVISSWTMVPMASAFTSAIAAWAFDGPPILGFAAVVLFVSSIGIGVTRFLLCLDPLMQKTWNKLQEEKVEEEEESRNKRISVAANTLIDCWNDMPSGFGDSLVELKNAYDTFVKKVKKSEVKIAAKSQLVDKVDKLFYQSLSDTEEYCELIKSAVAIGINSKAKLARAKVIKSAGKEEMERLAKAVETIQTVTSGCIDLISDKNPDNDVSALSEEVEMTMRAATAAETTMRKIKEGMTI